MIDSHHIFHMMRLALNEGNRNSILITSHTVAVMGLGQVGFMHGLSPQVGFEPASHTSEALAERYLNDSQLTLGSYSFRPSTSSSLIVLSQIHCPGECCGAIPVLLSNNLARQYSSTVTHLCTNGGSYEHTNTSVILILYVQHVQSSSG
jgi:hypothetical protein